MISCFRYILWNESPHQMAVTVMGWEHV